MSLIPDDRMDVQALVQSLTDYLDAKAEHDKARDGYQGYSWGYYGAGHINRMNTAAREVGAQLDRYVDERVASALAHSARSP